MPKMPSLTPREITRKLKKLGFIEDRVRGSHHIYYHIKTGRRAVIPFHTKDVKPGTLSAILREARISREEFLKV